jgi:predicted glutamine amidotransferase
MCRLFGFRSIFSSQMHRSLLHAENALKYQSENHPDGWGVAYYLDECPHLIKSIDTAVDDSLFEKVSGIVSSETVLAHLRKTTIGENSILNTHPFQHGKWVFAHNGNIKHFLKFQSQLLGLVDEDLRSFILGATDSEIIFSIIISQIRKESRGSENAIISSQELCRATRSAIDKITSIVGPHSTQDADPPTETFLSFILTNGHAMLCYNGGKTIHYSTHKKICPDKKGCSFLNESCEAPVPFKSTTQRVNHLILSSEPIQGSNVWNEVRVGQIVGVDEHMVFFTD